MTPEPENFTDLRRLLALKRHEQPPPGYFTNFSAKVIARIEARRPAAGLSWWQRLLTGMDVKPALVCTYALTVAGLLVVGLGLVSSDDGTAAGLPLAPTPTLVAHPVTATPVPPSAAVQSQMTLQPMQSLEQNSSVDPVLNPDMAPSGFFNPNGFVRPAQVNETFLLDTAR